MNTRAKYKDNPKWAAADKKYRLSEKGKETKNRYNNTDKGREANRRYKQSERGKIADVKYTTSIRGRINALTNSARQRAMRKKLIFDIDFENLVARIEANGGRCEVTGVPLDFSLRGNGKKNPRAPSLDQKVPGLGYTETNVQITTVWFNHMKSDLTTEEAIELLEEWRQTR